MKYHIKNFISKRELKKQGLNILPLMKFKPEDVLEASELKRPKSRRWNVQQDNDVTKDV